MKFLISGDFYVTDSFASKDLISLDISELFHASDFNILNLESPVSSPRKLRKITKTGPHMISNVSIFEHLKKLSIKLVTLANNHIMDFGPDGLQDTMTNCTNNSIAFVGAGMNLEKAQKPFIIEYAGHRIAILNFAENEWASAEKNKAGANPIDIIENIRQIRTLRNQNDFVIIIIHGGHEYSNLPSPRMVNQYRFYAENGASLIVGHHPHFISGFEVFKGVPIFYSLGNMLFTTPSVHDDWYKGLILQLDLKEDMSFNFELLPIRQDKKDFTLSLVKNSEKKSEMDKIAGYSEIISNEAELEKGWKIFLAEKKIQYLNSYNPLNSIKNKYIRKSLKILLRPFMLNRDHFLQVLNNIRCEAHNEASKEIIEKYIENK